MPIVYSFVMKKKKEKREREAMTTRSCHLYITVTATLFLIFTQIPIGSPPFLLNDLPALGNLPVAKINKPIASPDLHHCHSKTCYRKLRHDLYFMNT